MIVRDLRLLTSETALLDTNDSRELRLYDDLLEALEVIRIDRPLIDDDCRLDEGLLTDLDLLRRIDSTLLRLLIARCRARARLTRILRR